MEVKRAIERAGGLLTMADVAQDLGVSRQAVAKMRGKHGFPEPVAKVAGRELYAANEVASWKEGRDGGVRRPD